MDKNWERYTKARDPDARDQLILEYLPIVKIVAGRLAVRFYGHVDMDDLVSYGIFGLIDAIDKFDHGKGVKFETYASLRIRGSIIDSIRRLDWVPRALRQDNKKLDQAYAQLEAKLGREPKDDEVAESLGVGVDEVREMMRKAQLASFISLDEFSDQSHGPAPAASIAGGSEDEPETQLLRTEAADMLAAAIEKLTDKERMVVTLYYYEELTLKEISKVLSVTESRVSQIHSKAIFKLKNRLGGYISGINW